MVNVLHGPAQASVSSACDAGVAAVVTPAVKLLDRIYATRITLEGLAAKYGERPLEWPVHVVEQLTERNHVILSQIEEHIGSMPTGLFHPLGIFPPVTLRPLIPFWKHSFSKPSYDADSGLLSTCDSAVTSLVNVTAPECSRIVPGCGHSLLT